MHLVNLDQSLQPPLPFCIENPNAPSAEVILLFILLFLQFQYSVLQIKADLIIYHLYFESFEQINRLNVSIIVTPGKILKVHVYQPSTDTDNIFKKENITTKYSYTYRLF